MIKKSSGGKRKAPVPEKTGTGARYSVQIVHPLQEIMGLPVANKTGAFDCQKIFTRCNGFARVCYRLELFHRLMGMFYRLTEYFTV